MARTYAKAEMNFIDTTALAEAVESTEDNQSFGNLALLKEDVDPTDYINLGLNYSILDGSLSEMPDDVSDVVFWSTQKSNENCTFDDNPAIVIQFTNNHTSAGLTVHFGAEIPDQFVVSWYDLNDVLIDECTFQPSTTQYFCNKQVENYGKIVITFTQTELPYRYVYLSKIDYGLVLNWQDGLIQQASITEEVDETNNTLPINTCTISIIDANNDFDIANANGAWSAVQKNQEITLQEVIDDTEVIECGTFYMKSWSFANNVAKFSLVDGIGYMDNYTFYGGIYTDVTVASIVADIFSVCGLSYELDETLGAYTLSGYLGIMSCRAALQQVCFAIGALADCSRTNTVNIYAPDQYVSHIIGIDRKFNGATKVELDEYISGIKVTAKKYKKSTDLEEIYSGDLPAGSTRIEYSEPYGTDITVSAGEITEAHINYCIITMAAAGECTISGYKYNGTDFSFVKSVDSIAAGEAETIKEFTCSLYGSMMLTVMASLLEYYSMRQMVQMRYLIDTEKVGEWCTVKDKRGNNMATLLYSQTIDLSGGFIATAKCRGYSLVTTSWYYTGNDDLYADGDFLI